ncbi:conserved hypothetical protein [Solidesulfovibrio fructosivorans JJ]]|uniref:Lipocalin-like domain-containing protein n=1 Tax=Solidesulfovibrio fructosivorans JJ] TaxID=596151 RepID=E1JWC1_SOLFR|nr:hypothetical protein [Solidesulfovibrio fructosivorans]EFL51218.1 conserved hypothetical protein [Solidesulfovibrio fructosivorans JJ]]
MFRVRILAILVMLGLVLTALPALAKEHKEKKEKAVPDVTGVWKGTSDTVAMGKLGHADAVHSPQFLHADWTLTIDKQEGRAFYGTKASARAKETVVGVIDGAAKLYMADDDGVYIGKLTGKNTMIITYVEGTKESKVASITHYRREAADQKKEESKK